MMKYFFLTIVILSTTTLSYSQTTTIEIPLPELYGVYEFQYEIVGTVKTATFSIDADVDEILSGSFRIGGVADVGLLQDCSSGDLANWGLAAELFISNEHTGGGWDDTLFVGQNGEFESSSSSYIGFRYYPFDGQDTETMSYLLDGEHVISLRMSTRGYPFDQCPYELPDGMDLSEAVLVLTVPDTTPVEQQSWDGVKALFR